MKPWVVKLYKGIKEGRKRDPIFFNSEESNKIQNEFIELELRGVKVVKVKYLENNYYFVIEIPGFVPEYMGEIFNRVWDLAKKHVKTTYIILCPGTIDKLKLEKGVSLEQFL